MITEPTIAFERKNQDVVQGFNFLHIMLASNDDWVIPAGIDERRFLVADANTKWQGNTNKWKALHQELSNNNDSGYRRMLWDMQKHKIPAGWTPRDIPMTEGLIDQKIRSMSPLRQYLFNALVLNVWPFEVREREDGTVRVFYEDFRADFQHFCETSRINPGGMGRGNTRFVLRELHDIFPSSLIDLRDPVPDDRSDIRKSPSDGRAQAIQLPSMADCRAEFERQLGGSLSWQGEEDWLG
jgi:hypothetical protein